MVLNLITPFAAWVGVYSIPNSLYRIAIIPTHPLPNQKPRAVTNETKLQYGALFVAGVCSTPSATRKPPRVINVQTPKLCHPGLSLKTYATFICSCFTWVPWFTLRRRDMFFVVLYI